MSNMDGVGEVDGMGDRDGEWGIEMGSGRYGWGGAYGWRTTIDENRYGIAFEMEGVAAKWGLSLEMGGTISFSVYVLL